MKNEKTIGYCKRKEESTSTESGEEQFSESSEEHVSSEELSSEEEFSSEGNYTEKSECSSSGEEFTEEYSETEESFKEKPNRINQKKKKVYRSLKSFIPTIKKEEKEYVKLLILFINNKVAIWLYAEMFSVITITDSHDKIYTTSGLFFPIQPKVW